MKAPMLAAAFVLVSLPAFAMDMPMAVQANALKWGPAPPALPPGAQAAVVSGDPGKEAPYVVRLKLPKGYTVAPHTHPIDENVTVLSGTFHIAMGDKIDKTKGESVKAGGFFTAAKGMQHYAWAETPAVIQVHGIGPFAITYVNPADDPRNKPTAQAMPDKK